MTSPGPELDAARARAVEHGLTAEAVGRLTEVVSGHSLEALAPVKQQLKRFFSAQPWTESDDEALADAVGGGTGGGRHELEPGLILVWGWDDGRFRLRIESEHPAAPPPLDDPPRAAVDLDWTFDGDVVPEPTPSPRTLRFATPPLHTGPSRAFDSAADAAGDPAVARIFAEFDETTNVLVGPDFVAITIARPERWEALLGPMLRAVNEGFTGSDAESPAPEPRVTRSLSVGSREGAAREPRRLERAWGELGVLRADQPEDLARILEAARDAEPARRQVAAALVGEAAPTIAVDVWQRLLGDPSRVVRRSVVDAVAGARREELRPLLEEALDDADAWIRWKALQGIAALGGDASRSAVEARRDDPDFRVRLQAAHVLAAGRRTPTES